MVKDSNGAAKESSVEKKPDNYIDTKARPSSLLRFNKGNSFKSEIKKLFGFNKNNSDEKDNKKKWSGER